MTLRLGGDGAITGCTSLEEPTISISGLTMTTPIEAIPGTAAAPSYTFSGDTDNGLYYAGTNSIGLSTAGTNAILIDSSGRVGIGTTSPDAPLQVGVLDSPGTLRGGLAVKTVSNGLGNSEAAIYIEESSGGEGYYLRVDSDGGLAFDNSAAIPPTLYLSDSNKVGIGTSSPVRTLHIHESSSSDNAYVHLTSATTGTTTSDGLSLFLYGSGGLKDGVLTLRETANLLFKTGDLERMRIDSSGNVGIGTSSPLAKLHIGAGTGGIRFGVSGATPKADIEYTNGGAEFLDIKVQGTTTGHGNIRFSTGPTPTEQMRIDSSGRVLVGTSSSLSLNGAQSRLQVAGTTYENSSIAIRRDSANANPPAIIFGKSRGSLGGNTVVQNNDKLGELNFTGADGTDLTTIGAQIKAEVDGTPGSNDMPGRLMFSTTADGASSPTERLRIDSSGQVGIGTSSVNFSAFGSNTGGVAIEDVGSSNTGLKIGDGSNTNFLIAAGNGNFYLSHYGSGSMLFSVGANAGTERMRIDSAGRLLINTTTGSAGSQNYHALISTLATNTEESVGIQYPGIATYGFSVRSNGDLQINKDGTERMRIDNSGSILFTTRGLSIEPDGSGDPRIRADSDPITVLSGSSNGVKLAVNGGTWTNLSDESAKTDLVLIENGAEKIKQVRALTGRYITDDQDVRRAFLVAQDIEKVLPEATLEFEPGKLGLNYTDVIPLLLAGLQETLAKVEALEIEVATLKAQ